MRIVTNVIKRKNINMFFGIKIYRKIKQKVIKVNSYSVKFKVIHINSTDNHCLDNPVVFNCSGNIFLTVGNILKKFNLSGEMILTKERKMFRLRESDRVFDKCLYFEKYGESSIGKNSNTKSPVSTFNILPNCNLFLFKTNNFKWTHALTNIKKLVIKNNWIQNVCLDSLPFLKHLDLSCNYIENIAYNKSLHYCNLSNNNLENININSNNLNISFNRIVFFYSHHKIQVLNLKNNPLEVLSATAQIVNVSNTKIRNIFCKSIKKLICSNNRNIKLFNTEDLVYLNLNNCKLMDVKFDLNNLKVVKLRNNQLKTIPFTGPLIYLDVSGNKINCLPNHTFKYLNVSRNPIKHIISPNDSKYIDFSYTFNGLCDTRKIVNNLLNFNAISRTFHHFNRIQQYCVYIPRFVFCKLYFIVAFDFNLDVENCISRSLSNHDIHLTNFEYFNAMIDRVTNLLGECGGRSVFYALLIEESKVMLKSFNLPVVFTNFTVHKIIENNDNFCIFENIGRWYIFPLLGCTEVIRKKMCYVGECDAIYSYMDICCSFTREIGLRNTSELYTEISTGVHLVKDYSLKGRCDIDIRSYKYGSTSILGENEVGPSIIPTYDINSNEDDLLCNSLYNFLPCPGLTNKSTENDVFKPTNTFVFLKFKSVKHKDCLKIAPLSYIISTLCKIFNVVLFEEHEHQCGVFICFDKSQGLIFAMYVYRILTAKNIRLSIGIVGGEYSIRWSLIFPKVFGFGLNKSARYAAMGEGIFCCKCVAFDHNNLMFISHDKKMLKGISERMEVFSVHYKNPCKKFL